MTMRPKGRKFRIRRGFGAEDGDRSITDEAVSEGADAASDIERYVEDPEPQSSAEADGASNVPGDTPEPQSSEAAAPETPAAAPGDEEETPRSPATNSDADKAIDAIKAEGLTGRQLRMARRTALKHGISASSDYDAVGQLRQRGIDPFARTNMLELIVSDTPAGGQTPQPAADAKAAPAAGAAALPAKRGTTQPSAPPVVPQGPIDEASRAAEIMRVQRDIANRRKRRLALLGVRLMFFVLLPTFIAGYYFYVVATPLYATHTEFVIDKQESGGGGGALGGLLGGTSLASATESITVQSFLESREAMLRLDEELDFRGHFSSASIDPLTRLDPDASNEAMYDVYRRNLTIGYDPTEGIIRMEVRAADPELSQAFSAALIRYAEERVDDMRLRVREDQMAGARDSYDDAEERMVLSQLRVLELQEQRGVLSTEAEVSTVFNQISTFELQLQEERIRLLELLSVARPNETRVEQSRNTIERLETTIDGLRSGLTTASGDNVSLARISSELVVAQADMETRQMILAQALQAMETARIEANRQSLYLSISVFPVAPDAAAYPKSLENTLLTFFVFAGIYLMLSMTIAILREQVSA